MREERQQRGRWGRQWDERDSQPCPGQQASARHRRSSARSPSSPILMSGVRMPASEPMALMMALPSSNATCGGMGGRCVVEGGEERGGGAARATSSSRRAAGRHRAGPLGAGSRNRCRVRAARGGACGWSPAGAQAQGGELAMVHGRWCIAHRQLLAVVGGDQLLAVRQVAGEDGGAGDQVVPLQVVQQVP